MKLRLRVAAGGEPYTFEHPGPRCRIGRDPACELAFPGDQNDGVSWSHAQIELTPGGAWVSDLGSSNGTYVAGQRVEGRTALAAGSEVRLGQAGPRLQVLDLDLGAPPRPASTSAPPASKRKAAGTAALPGGWPSRVPILAMAGMLLVVVLVLWRFGARLGELGDRAGELSRRVDDLSAQNAELTQKLEGLSRDRDQDLLRQQTAELTASIGQLRQVLERPGVLGTAGEVAPAPDEKPPEPPRSRRVELGKLAAGSADAPPLVLCRTDASRWQRLRPGDRVRSTEPLTSLPQSRGEVALDSGVALRLQGEVSGTASAAPVMESRVVLFEPAGVDLDCAIERGRVVVANCKPRGAAARARVRAGEYTWDLILPDGESEAAVEMRTVYPPGTAVRTEEAGPEPVKVLTVITRGRAEVKAWKPVLPQNPDNLEYAHPLEGEAGTPAWWMPGAVPVPPVLARAYQGLCQRMPSGDEPPDVQLLRVEKDAAAPVEVRQLAVYSLAALDRPAGVVDALEDVQEAKMRVSALWALRCWLGRRGEHDLQLQRYLWSERGFSPEQARALVILLHGYGAPDRGRPATYADLIRWLEDDKLAVRQMAAWWLQILAPDQAAAVAKENPYDPTQPAEKRTAAARQWKRLIPEGQIPVPRS